MYCGYEYVRKNATANEIFLAIIFKLRSYLTRTVITRRVRTKCTVIAILTEGDIILKDKYTL